MRTERTDASCGYPFELDSRFRVVATDRGHGLHAGLSSGTMQREPLPRRDATGEETTVLERGVSIDIPVGMAFQYRCTGADPLQFLCISTPRCPADKEATVIEGPWQPNAPEGWLPPHR